MRELAVVIPIPNKATHPNNRVASVRFHARWVKKQRADAALACVCAMNNAGLNKPRWPAAEISITYENCGNDAKIHDEANLIGWLKSSTDGLQDAGLILDDRGVKWGKVTQYIRTSTKERKITLTVRPI